MFVTLKLIELKCKTICYASTVSYCKPLSNDGVAEKHGDDYEKDYFTDVIREQAVDFINQRSKTGKPFFMYIAPPAFSRLRSI